MGAQILDGKAIAAEIRQELEAVRQAASIVPAAPEIEVLPEYDEIAAELGLGARIIGRTEASTRPDGANHVTIIKDGQTLAYA